MNAARSYCRGLRIIRQPKWECLATFICSSMKQVAHIRQISRKLRQRFGEGAQDRPANRLSVFLRLREIAQSSESELRECALGYRAKFGGYGATCRFRRSRSGSMVGTGRCRAPSEALRASWVGAKVANCVMLFAYERLRAFPIDVWIERVLRESISGKKKSDSWPAACICRKPLRRARRVCQQVFISSCAHNSTEIGKCKRFLGCAALRSE